MGLRKLDELRFAGRPAALSFSRVLRLQLRRHHSSTATLDHSSSDPLAIALLYHNELNVDSRHYFTGNADDEGAG